MIRKILHCLTIILLVSIIAPSVAFGDEQQTDTAYYFGETVDAGLDTGYSESTEISRDNWHFGWELGKFVVSGYTSVHESEQGYPVFLKTTGDEIQLTFKLEQNIDALNSNENLIVWGDNNGYNVHFGIDKTDFGRGTLIVRQTNYQNSISEPQIYTNYLSGIEDNANTEIILLEEGNYEVQLDYELRNNLRKIGPLSVFPDYADYKIDFYFQVRNGNCMVYPFDLTTGSELTNESYAPNGFYLDLAKSRYLDVNVKKEVMSAGANGLVEDTRFNGPARDGDKYTEEGIYTITASNPSTRQETVKKIYVGNNPVLKAYAVTGMSIEQINEHLAEGYTINEDGILITPSYNTAESTYSSERKNDNLAIVCIAIICFVAAIAVMIILQRGKKKLRLPKETNQLPPNDDSFFIDNNRSNKQ
jgi:hypothetical protein